MKLRSLLIGAALCAPLPLLAASNPLDPNSGDIELQGTGTMQLIITPSSGPTGGCASGYSWNTTYGGCRRAATETATDSRACPAGTVGGPQTRNRTRTNYILQANASSVANGPWGAWSAWVGKCLDNPIPDAGCALDTHIYDGTTQKYTRNSFGACDSKPYSRAWSYGAESEQICADDPYSSEMWFLREFDGNSFKNAAWEGAETDGKGGSTIVFTRLFNNAWWFNESGEASRLNINRLNPNWYAGSPRNPLSTIPHYYDASGYLRINLTGVLDPCHGTSNCQSWAGDRVGSQHSYNGPYRVGAHVNTDLSALIPLGCLYDDFYSNWDTYNRAGSKQRLTTEQIKKQVVTFNINTNWPDNQRILDRQFPLPCYRQP